MSGVPGSREREWRTPFPGVAFRSRCSFSDDVYGVYVSAKFISAGLLVTRMAYGS